MPEVLQHHRGGPDLADRVGDALAVDVGGRAVHRFEQRRELTWRVQVGRRRYSDGAGARGAEVGQDVAEQVGRDHDVEPLRVQHEVGGQDVDVVLAGVHVGVGSRHLGEALVPVRHRDEDAVGLGG